MRNLQSIRVLHCFSYFLPKSEVWAKELISSIPGVEITITARHFLFNPNYINNVKYLGSVLDVNRASNWHKNIFLRVINKLFKKYLYPLLVQRSIKGFNIIHTHFAPTGIYFEHILKNREIPHVVSFYGYDYEHLPFRSPIFVKYYKELFSRVDKVITEGPHGSKILAQMGADSKKIEIVPLGIKVPPGFTPLRKNRSGGKFRIVQVARISEKKGQLDTIESFLMAFKKDNRLELTFVGEGDEVILAQLKKFVALNKLERVVHFQKFVPHDQLHEYLSSFDLFIHPSKYTSQKDCEGGAPVVLLNAQLAGLPVVATTHCDIPFEVNHGKTGILCPEGDILAISNAILKMAQCCNEEFEEFTLQAQLHVIENFNIAESGARLREVYEKLLIE